MSSILRFAAASPVIAALMFSSHTVAFAQTSSPTPVLVELFTSEGCSSCPPADALLGRLVREQPISSANIIVLEEHVDYWDQDGWHDRFSSSEYTQRQKDYAFRLKFQDPYTPQMIVDGNTEFTGNNGQKAVDAITKAAETPKVTLALSTPVIDGKRIGCSVSATSQAPLPKADLYAVVVQATATTEVKAGENSGHHLDHVDVVRSMQRIGKLQDIGSAPLQFHVNAPADVQPANLRLVVFAQGSGQGPIRGVATVAAAQ